MKAKSMMSPEDQGATFVELFFDLVFVYAITQITHYAAHHLDAQGVLRSVVVFWLIWWGWTQFTWALNAADTDHHHVRVGTLIATGVAFAMAVSVDAAFAAASRKALLFAVSYVVVRTLGLGLYYKVVASNADQRSAVVYFSTLSLGGLAAVLVGAFVDPAVRQWVWFVAIGLDFGAAWIAGNSSGAWGLHAAHFAERHGLIVIIALGESLIVAGSGLTPDVGGSLMLTGALAVFATCLLWWTYFGWVHGVLEEELVSLAGRERARLGRDAFSLWHFPLVSGIVALAVGFEASLHPGDYTMAQTAVAVGVGLTLFLAATAGALWRAKRCFLWNRLIVLAVTLGGLILAAGYSASHVLATAGAGLALIVTIEQITVRWRLARA